MTKFMNPKEARDMGLIHEVNRLFFHPLGLALALGQNEVGELTIDGIWDSRDDPEGIVFHKSTLDINKARNVFDNYTRRLPARVKALGYAIQPVFGKEEADFNKQYVEELLRAQTQTKAKTP